MTAEEIAEKVCASMASNNQENIKMDGAGTGLKAIPEVESDGVGGILCENLSYVYNKKSPFATQALNGVDLQIYPGDFFGIIGHTGSGKSTFVQHLNALLKVYTAEKKYLKHA